MKAFITMLMMGWAMVGLAACQTESVPYDGVSRFAGSGYWDSYYGPGSPPRDTPAPPKPDFPPGTTGKG